MKTNALGAGALKPPAGKVEGRDAKPVDARQRQAFEQFLADKELACDRADAPGERDALDEVDAGAGTIGAACPEAAAGACIALPGRCDAPRSVEVSAARGIASEPPASVTVQQRDAIAALAAAADLRMNPLTGQDASNPARSWQVSIHEPMGLSLAVQVCREATAPGAGLRTPWSIGIASPQLDTQRFARHAPRLAARLRRRAPHDVELQFNDDDPQEAAS